MWVSRRERDNSMGPLLRRHDHSDRLEEYPGSLSDELLQERWRPKRQLRSDKIHRKISPFDTFGSMTRSQADVREDSMVASEVKQCNLAGRGIVVEDLENALRLWSSPTVLIAARNLLERLPSNAPSTILCLDLSRNRLPQLQGFEALPHLRELDVSHNNLTSTCGLATNTELSVLKMSHNRARCVEALEQLKKLKEADLSHNLFRFSMDVRSLSLNAALRSLRMDGNPLCSAGGTRDSYRLLLQHLLPAITQLDGQPSRPVCGIVNPKSKVSGADKDSRQRSSWLPSSAYEPKSEGCTTVQRGSYTALYKARSGRQETLSQETGPLDSGAAPQQAVRRAKVKGGEGVTGMATATLRARGEGSWPGMLGPRAMPSNSTTVVGKKKVKTPWRNSTSIPLAVQANCHQSNSDGVFVYEQEPKDSSKILHQVASGEGQRVGQDMDKGQVQGHVQGQLLGGGSIAQTAMQKRRGTRARFVVGDGPGGRASRSARTNCGVDKCDLQGSFIQQSTSTGATVLPGQGKRRNRQNQRWGAVNETQGAWSRVSSSTRSHRHQASGCNMTAAQRDPSKKQGRCSVGGGCSGGDNGPAAPTSNNTLNSSSQHCTRGFHSGLGVSNVARSSRAMPSMRSRVRRRGRSTRSGGCGGGSSSTMMAATVRRPGNGRRSARSEGRAEKGKESATQDTGKGFHFEVTLGRRGRQGVSRPKAPLSSPSAAQDDSVPQRTIRPVQSWQNWGGGVPETFCGVEAGVGYEYMKCADQVATPEPFEAWVEGGTNEGQRGYGRGNSTRGEPLMTAGGRAVSPARQLGAFVSPLSPNGIRRRAREFQSAAESVGPTTLPMLKRTYSNAEDQAYQANWIPQDQQARVGCNLSCQEGHKLGPGQRYGSGVDQGLLHHRRQSSDCEDAWYETQSSIPYNHVVSHTPGIPQFPPTTDGRLEDTYEPTEYLHSLAANVPRIDTVAIPGQNTDDIFRGIRAESGGNNRQLGLNFIGRDSNSMAGDEVGKLASRQEVIDRRSHQAPSLAWKNYGHESVVERCTTQEAGHPEEHTQQANYNEEGDDERDYQAESQRAKETPREDGTLALNITDTPPPVPSLAPSTVRGRSAGDTGATALNESVLDALAFMVERKRCTLRALGQGGNDITTSTVPITVPPDSQATQHVVVGGEGRS